MGADCLWDISSPEWGELRTQVANTGVETSVDMTAGYCLYGMLVDDTQCVCFNRKPVVDTKTGQVANWPIRTVRTAGR